MSAPKIALTLCLALAAYAIGFTPDVQAGARSVGCSGELAGCGMPDLAFDVGCAEPAAASCGGERSILLVRGERRWIPGERIYRGVRGLLSAPFDGSRTFRPQRRIHRGHRFGGCG